MLYYLYNADKKVASFTYDKGLITDYTVIEFCLLPFQIRKTSADGFAQWIRERAIDLNTFLHRQLANELIGSRDKTAIAILTHMYSVSDTFTCFAEGEFIPRANLCKLEEHDAVSDFVLISSDTSLRKQGIVTPNASTDGSFPKTWKYEDGAWWLYKLQSDDATCSECEISHALMDCGWDVAEYQYCGDARNRIKSKNFVGKNEFFEPYDSLRFLFGDKRDGEEVIYENISHLGRAFERAFRRILLADALFMNTDRHMRNFGIIRSSINGQVLRMAPNFDNNQAYKSNPVGKYSDAMLRSFEAVYGWTDDDAYDLAVLLKACEKRPYLQEAFIVGGTFLFNHR